MLFVADRADSLLAAEPCSVGFTGTRVQPGLFGRRKCFYHLHARRGFPTLRENPVCPFLGIFGWFSVSDYGAAGKLYVLNWKFWKPYSYLLASGWSLSTIFVMCCHVGAWSLGCELVPHSRKEMVPTSTMQGSNTGMLWTEPQKLLTEKKLGTSR